MPLEWCEDSFSKFTCREVTISMQVAKFAAAEALCHRQGGHMAGPLDEKANSQVHAALKNWQWAQGNTWIGVSRNKGAGDETTDRHPNTWRINKNGGLSTSIEYQNWAGGQPDGNFDGRHTDEKCVEMWTTSKWNDADCNDEKNYACEVEVPPTDTSFPCSLDSSLQCQYRLKLVKENAQQARASCEQQRTSLGSAITLAEPKTEVQVQILAKLLRIRECPTCPVAHDSIWLGLEGQTRGKGHFQWTGTGEALDEEVARWASGQPTLFGKGDVWGEDGMCVEMWGDGTWNDRDCNAKKVFACEQPVG